MQTYQYQLLVKSDDIDALEHVNNVRYVQWVQDAAEAHWNEVATQALKEGYIWMVLRHDIQYKGQAFEGDALLINTYVTKSEGVTSTRVVEISREDNNKLLVKATTQWCLLNKDTKRPTRLTPELIELFD
ncbi:acyl-CoA thioesterase [Robertkochia marina]|uniref:Acyl-CoA thioesterase n=1 Tax=Robertkochia marina TaxID=1227945 RepID=A0A4V3UY73_9FLAO|nr:thioesterase family protein [Robertkochia marina]THD67976.1 acyl-CoA thioesterase [Robertkochia marina]TRZ41527.1 acyl-CoA thioesterase [Robertkochia marina]